MSTSMKKWLLGSVAASLMVPVLPAMAQESQGTVAAGRPHEVEAISEVVVTARRREESILKVPVVAHVVDAKTLDQYAVSDLSAISTRVPGLNIGMATSSFGNQVSLRGIGTVTQNATIDQSVSLNIDGMQMTQGLAYAMGFFDMAHVEVLKGPQALFFGKASPAGVISVRSADPTGEFEAVARAGYEFEAKNKQAELIISGPVTDTLRVRLAGSYSDADGFFKSKGLAPNLGFLSNLDPALAPFNAVYGPLGSLGAANPTSFRTPHTKNTMLRATVLWDPTDAFTARLKMNYAKMEIEGVGYSVQLGSCLNGTAPTGLPIRFISPAEDCHLDRTQLEVAMDPTAYPGNFASPGVYNGGRSFTESEQAFGTLELTYQINPSLTLSSLTGAYTLDQQSAINGSLASYAGPPFVVQGKFGRDDFTQELRLTSDYDGPVNFMVGGFYQNGKTTFLVDLPTNQRLGELMGFLGELRAIQALGRTPAAGARMGALLANPHGYQALPATLATGDHTVKSETESVFGQLLWKLRPDLELGVGARWTSEERTHKQVTLFMANRSNPGTSFITPGTVANLAVPKISSKNWSPELSLTYTPTDDLTFFGSLKQAYKSGSFITSGTFVDGDDTSFGDERVRGSEIGMKSRLLDGALQLNLAGYSYKYKGLQVGTNELSPSQTIILYTRNAAGAKSYGVDFDLAYKPSVIDGLMLTGAANWNISKYTSFKDAPCLNEQTAAQGCVAGSQDLTGRPLVRAPKWTVNLGADYERPIGDDLTLALGVSTQYTSDYYTNMLLRPDMLEKGFYKTSANVSLRSDNNAWEVALIGTNIFNKIVSGNCTNGNYRDGYKFFAAPRTPEELACTVEPGRSVMVRFTVRPSELMH